MKFLDKFLGEDKDYIRLLKSIEEGSFPIALSGLTGIGKAVIASALVSGGKRLVMITDTEAAASGLKDDLLALGVKAGHLPARDYNLASADGYSKEYEIMRIDTLSRIFGGDFGVVCASVESATQYTLPPEVLAENTFKISEGDAVDTVKLSEKLTQGGYKKSDICEGTGQFSVRGGIIDVFSPGYDMPVRIELWGDEVDSISFFDTVSQRRTSKINAVKISPACELPYRDDDLARRLEAYLEDDKKLSDLQSRSIAADIEKLEDGLSVNADLYLPFLYEKRATLFDYTVDYRIGFCESANIKSKFESLLLNEAGDIADLLESGLLSHKSANIRLTKSELSKYVDKALFFESFGRSSYPAAPKITVDFDFKRFSPWGGNLENLIDDINGIRALSGTAVVFAGGEKAAGLLAQTLSENRVPAQYIKGESTIKPGGVFVLAGGLSSSFQLTNEKLLVITHRHISASSKRRKNFKPGKAIGSLDEMEKGDLVVHAMHGIGVFDGINRISRAGIT
ncbi:MAG: hypothetical protein J5662_01655, partial [Clostridia bacterium]|nr:hypothetical protein [Clostridia bacterium]